RSLGTRSRLLPFLERVVDFARFAPLEWTDEPSLVEELHEAGGAGVADLELALEECNRTPLRAEDYLHRLLEELVLLDAVRRRLDTETRKFWIVLRFRLARRRRHDVADLLVREVGALDPHDVRGAGREEEAVAFSKELVRPVSVEDGSRVDARRDAEGDSRRHVRLDQTGDDVDRRALRREDHVDSDGARLL